MTAVSPAVMHRVGGQGPPVLLVHGFGADRFGWGANAHALMRSHTVWAVDLPGHGSAGNAVGDGSPAALARGLVAVLGTPGEPVGVVAHSLGAAVVLHAARSEPDLFVRLILVAPAGLGAGLDRDFLARFAALQTIEDAETLLARLVARPALVPPMASHVMQGLKDPGRRLALAAIAAALGDAPSPPPPPVGRRVTVVWGAADRMIPPPAGPVLGVAPVLIPEAGHLPHVEAAGAVNRLLAAGLA